MIRRAVLALALAACGGAPHAAGTPLPPEPAPEPAPAPPPAPAPAPAPPPVAARPTFPGVPATKVGDQLAWVLDLIVHRHGQTDKDELAAHFHPSFLAQVPPEQMLSLLGQIAGKMADLAVTGAKGDDHDLLVHATAGKDRLRIQISLDPSSGLIQGLLFQPDVDLGPKPASFDEVQQRAAALAPKVQYLVAELDKGTCKPLHELAPRDELALGSAFKLYVLLGVADKVIAGKLGWDDQVAIRDDWKSLPSGTTQNEPAGTKLSVRELAQRMISISDNTAADHLLYTIGRPAAEAALREAHHAHPELDVPFLSTRELFLFKLGMPEAEIARYLAMSPARRRSYLDKTLAGKAPDLSGAAAWTTARHIDKLEWFASADDMCRVMATLWQRGQDPKAQPVFDILGKNPGLPIDHKVWPYAGFKGGSEPGVVNMTYLLRRDDDKWFVVTFGFNAANGGTLEEDKIFGLVAGTIALLGEQR